MIIYNIAKAMPSYLPPDMISPGLVGCGGMMMLLSSSRIIKISGKKSFVWFKRSLPFCGMGRTC